MPATSANLGPAFDAAALAFSMYLRVKTRVSDEFSITAKGRDAQICGNLHNHLILDTYREVLESEEKAILPLALQINNKIPIGKGCGSSAAARLAGIALAVHFGKLRWSDSQIVSEAARREHHPDNAAACWLGGVAVAGTANGWTVTASISPKGRWPLLLALPSEALSTEKARRVLPDQYSRADAVTNIQSSALLITAFTQGRPDLLRAALHDRMHEPYRAALCPLLPALQQLKSFKMIGVALSGAGPSVLIFLNPQSNVDTATREVARHLKIRGLSAELLPARITLRGARECWAV